MINQILIGVLMLPSRMANTETLFVTLEQDNNRAAASLGFDSQAMMSMLSKAHRWDLTCISSKSLLMDMNAVDNKSPDHIF